MHFKNTKAEPVKEEFSPLAPYPHIPEKLLVQFSQGESGIHVEVYENLSTSCEMLGWVKHKLE